MGTGESVEAAFTLTHESPGLPLGDMLQASSVTGFEERSSEGGARTALVSRLSGALSHGPADSPPEVVEEQWRIEPQGEPLLCAQEHDTEEAVDGVLRQHQLGRVDTWLAGSTPPAGTPFW